MNDRTPFPNSSPGARSTTGLAKLSLALRNAAWRQGRPEELTPTQGEALMQLDRSPGSTLGEIAEALAVSAPTASEAVSTLESKGLVKRGRSSQDRRRLAIVLTSRGTRVAKRVALWPNFLARVVDDLEPEEQGELMRLLQRMIRKLQVRGEIPISRMCATCTHFQPWTHEEPAAPHHCAYIDAAFGNRDLRLDCSDHSQAAEAEAERAWRRFSAGRP